MKNFKSYLSFTLLIIGSYVYAQQTPFSSQYYTNQFVTNPAITGIKNTTNTFITHRSQWTGIEGAPQTTYVSVDGSVRSDKVGLGLVFCSDVTGILSRNSINANYAYKLNINSDNSLRFGLSLGIMNNRIDFTKATVFDLTDPMLSSQEQVRTNLNADFGLLYSWKRLEVGFAAPQLLANQIDYKNNIGMTGFYNLSRHYYGSLKYVFDILPSMGITAYPLVMIRSVAGAPLQYDVNAVVDWSDYGWLAGTYHSDYGMAISAGVRFKGLSVGYAQNFVTNQIQNYVGSTSEFLLGYTFDKKDQGMSELNTLREEIAALKINDSIQDSLINDLKALVDSNKVEIEKLMALHNEANDSLQKAMLEAELAKLKDKEDSANLALKMAENNIEMKTGSTSDFESEGHDTDAGYYVIIGAFNNHDNAEMFTKDAKAKGYPTAEIIQNKNNQIYEIVVFKTQNKQEAIDKLDGIKSDYFDVWVLTLK